MFRRTRTKREPHKARHAGEAPVPLQAELPLPSSGPTAEAPEAEFLPPDFRAPSRQDVAGFMMPWNRPLVIDGEIRECPECGAYRNWVVFNMRDGSIWLRCAAGHETKETRLDTAWYNRHSGPVDQFHATLDEGLRHLGH